MTFFPRYSQVMKILNANQIQYHNQYIRIYMDQRF